MTGEKRKPAQCCNTGPAKEMKSSLREEAHQYDQRHTLSTAVSDPNPVPLV